MKKIFTLAFSLVAVFLLADVYFGDKAAVTSLHPTTNFLISVLGSSSNAPVRLINTSNLLAGYATSNDLVSATNSLATTNYVNSVTNTLASTNYVNSATQSQSNFRLLVQTNGTTVGLVTNVNYIGATGQLSSLTAIVGGFSGGGGSGSLTGTTNFLNLSVQAAKLPTTNYPGIDAGWQDWELLYYKTNAEGSIAPLAGSWQFILPNDYATNTLKVRIYSLLLSTNGPNSSNTIFRASVLRATPSDSTDLHTASFGSTVSGTTTWAASFNGTNKVQSVVINMSTTSALAPGDLCILKVDRDAATDTYGGVAALVGLQLEYTRP